VPTTELPLRGHGIRANTHPLSTG